MRYSFINTLQQPHSRPESCSRKPHPPTQDLALLTPKKAGGVLCAAIWIWTASHRLSISRIPKKTKHERFSNRPDSQPNRSGKS